MGCRRPAGVRRAVAVGGGGGKGLGKMAGASRGGGGHLRAGPSHLPAPQPAAGLGQVQARAPGNSRVFLPLLAATHPRNIEEADSELREDLCLGSPGKWSSQDAPSLHTQQLPAAFSGDPLCTSLRKLPIERICDPEWRRSLPGLGWPLPPRHAPLSIMDLALGSPSRQKDC